MEILRGGLPAGADMNLNDIDTELTRQWSDKFVRREYERQGRQDFHLGTGRKRK